MNAVIYARYSPGPRQTDQSIEGQVRDCMAYAKENDITVVDVYADRKISGSDFENREAFNRMIRDAEKHQFESVIVWKIDRFGRDREEITLNKIKLKRNGIKLLYAKEIIPDSPEGIILESLMEGLAEYYIADLRQKVKRGQRESALKGYVVTGSVPFGYDKIDKKLVINEHEAWAVRYIFDAYNSGSTALEIIAELKRLGYKTKKGADFSKNGLYKMMRNEKYIGKYEFDGIPVPVPAIVDEEVFNSVNKTFKSRKGHSAAYKANVKYLLSLKCYCGECGALMVGESGYGKQKVQYHYYKCGTRKKKNGSKNCTLKNFRKEYLEDFVVMHTINDVLQDDVIEYLADKVIKLRKKDVENVRLKEHTAALKANEKARNNIIAAIEAGIITDSTKDRLLELEAQAEELKVLIAREEIKKPDLTREHVIYWLNLFKQGDVEDPDFKQRLLDVFVNSVYVYNKKVVIAYNFADNNHSEAINPTDLKGSDISQTVRLGELYSNIFVFRNSFYLVVGA